MKPFNLTEFLHLKEEGKEPRIVTRNGRSARIVCTDMKAIGDELISTLVMEPCGKYEQIYLYYSDGSYQRGSEDALDLFFADLDPEPKYRPYKDAEECFKEVSKHGMIVRGSEDECYYLVSTISGSHVWLGTGQDGIPMENLLRDFMFIDGSPCGVKEE